MKNAATLSHSERTRLSPSGQILAGQLKPLLKDLSRHGWSEGEISAAVIDHYSLTEESILPEDLQQLLSRPADLIIKYRERRNKPNGPSLAQREVLKKIVPIAEQRDKVARFLAAHFVIDRLGAKPFHDIIQDFRLHDWVEPEVLTDPSAKSYQGRVLRWPGPSKEQPEDRPSPRAAQKREDILPGATSEASLFEGYHLFTKFITYKVMERLVWCLSTESSERIDASIKKAGELAEKVRPNWTKPNTTQTAEAELNLSSLPEWTTELFETSFVGRHAAFLGAMQGDEASFVALLLHNIFTMEAFKQVCNEQVELARKYASRMVVFPWFVSSVDNYEKDLKAKLEKIGFSSQTTKQGNLGSTLCQPAALDVLGAMLWLRLKADNSTNTNPDQHPLMDVLQTLPDLGEKKLAEVTGILQDAVIEVLIQEHGEKLHLNQAFSQRFPGANKEEIKDHVKRFVGAMLRPPTKAPAPG